MKLSRNISDFNSEVTVSIPYLTLNQLRLLLSAQQVLDLPAFLGNWSTKYLTYITAATHTEDSVLAIQTEYHLFHPYLEGIKQQLKNNKTITLLPLDFTTVHIHIDAPHRNRVPRPVIAPNNSVVKSTHLRAQVFSNNPNPPHEKEENMPIDVAKIGRKMAVVPAGAAAPALAQYHALEDIGSTIYDLVFSPEQGGAIGYLITWYINPTGQAGPPSEPLAFQIIGLPAA